LDVSLPEPSTQSEIVDRWRDLQHELNERLDFLNRSEALLLEFKRSLISAAVSGEFDVSTASGRGVPA
jgi:type I restriction enzyme S subunit